MDFEKYQSQLEKIIQRYQDELKSFQVGTANVNMLDAVVVKTDYGEMKVNQIAAISVLDPTTLKVEPRDKKNTKAIETAIYEADLGFTPKNEGSFLFIKIPEVTQERREQLAKKVKQVAEEAKAKVRMVRQDALKHNKQLEKDKQISEDEMKNNEQEIEELIKKYIQKIDEITDKKIEMIKGN